MYQLLVRSRSAARRWNVRTGLARAGRHTANSKTPQECMLDCDRGSRSRSIFHISLCAGPFCAPSLPSIHPSAAAVVCCVFWLLSPCPARPVLWCFELREVEVVPGRMQAHRPKTPRAR